MNVLVVAYTGPDIKIYNGPLHVLSQKTRDIIKQESPMDLHFRMEGTAHGRYSRVELWEELVNATVHRARLPPVGNTILNDSHVVSLILTD